MCYHTVAAAVQRRAEEKGWNDPLARRLQDRRAPRLETGRRWWSAALRRILGARIARSVIPIGLLVFVGLVAAPYWQNYLKVHSGPTGTATATVTGVVNEAVGPILPADYEVEFTTPDWDIETTVPGKGLRFGDRIEVRYLLAAPEWAEVSTPGRSGLVHGLAVTTAGMLLIVGYLTFRFLQTGRVIRVLWAAFRQPSVPARYVLFATRIGAMVALFDDVADGPARVVVPLLEDVAGALPTSGQALVHGGLDPGGTLVTRVGEATLWPSEPAMEAEPDLVAFLVNDIDPEADDPEADDTEVDDMEAAARTQPGG